MTNDDHAQLLDALLGLSGYVVLSGYATELYSSRLKDWKTFTTTSRISAGRGTTLRQEVVWVNPACSAALELENLQMRMFA